MSQPAISGTGKPMIVLPEIVKEPFWFEDPRVLFIKGAWRRILPAKGDMNAMLNTVMRWTIYISLVLYLWKRSITFLFAIPAVGIVSYLVWWNETRKQRILEKFIIEDGEQVYMDPDEGIHRTVVYPTIDNPFMNPLLTDYIDRPNRIAANNTTDDMRRSLREEINQKFYFNLYRDVDDIWEKDNSQRQFYTMPATTIPNDQGTFAEWCYGRVPTCKEGNGFQCVANNWDWLKDSYARNGVVPPFTEIAP